MKKHLEKQNIVRIFISVSKDIKLKYKPNKKIKIMAYKENEVVAKYTQGSMQSDCGEYSVHDLIEMFDQAEITVDEYGSTNGVTVNDCTEIYQSTLLVTEDLVVTSECDDMFCYYNKETVVPCSAELDYEFQQQSE